MKKKIVLSFAHAHLKAIPVKYSYFMKFSYFLTSAGCICRALSSFLKMGLNSVDDPVCYSKNHEEIV